MGAVTSGGTAVLNDTIIRELRIRAEVVESVRQRETANAQLQERTYRESRPPLQVAGATALVVDDGLATGATMRAAARSLRSLARRLIVAVPVGSIEACGELADDADLVICPWTPVPFGAVGQFYRDFQPTSDEEVRRLLAEAMKLT
jgi:predicted phosphoribosyltransferase